MRQRLFLLTVIFGASLGCEQQAPPPAEVGGRPVKMLTVGATGERDTREYSGEIASAQEVELSFEVPGQLLKLPDAATAGQAVEEGVVLARLDPANYQATVDAAKAQVDAAKSDVERKRRLIDIGGISKAALEEAERRFTSANADLETAEKALSDTELKAPFPGIVARTIAKSFSSVQAKQPIVTLQDPSWLEITVNIPEVDAALAIPGLSIEERNERFECQVVVSALPGRQFKARCSEFSTTADPVSRTYEATLIFTPPKDVSVLPGMTARVVVKFAEGVLGAASLRIPTQAVAGDDTGAPFVWVIGADMLAKKRPVKLGSISGSSVEVAEGLSAGDRIATSGVHHLRDGLEVREWEVE